MIYEYDLTAAYPSECANLFDTRKAVIEKSKEWLGREWGFLRGKVTIYPDVKTSPILVWCGDHYTSRTGTWEDSLTNFDVECINRWELGKVELYDGWWLTFTSKTKPFEVIMQRMYAYRSKSDIVDVIAKSLSVGFIGKMGEEFGDGRYGEYYNPFNRAIVQSKVRCKVCDFIYEHKLQDNLIAVMVDAVLTDKKVAGISNTKRFGEWRLAYKGQGIVLSNGMIWYGHKKPMGISYEQVMAAIEAHPNRTCYQIPLYYRQSLWESVQEGAIFGDLGKDKKHFTMVDLLTIEQDREFENLPSTGQQLLNNIYESNMKGVI